MTMSPSSRGPTAAPSSSTPNDNTSVGVSTPRWSRLRSRIRSASTNSTATCPSSMPALDSASAHSSSVSTAVGPPLGTDSIPRTSISSTSAVDLRPLARTQLGSRSLRGVVVCRDDPPHELVAHDVLIAEAHEVDPFHVLEDLRHHHQARIVLARQIDLRDVAGHDHLRVEAEPRQEHLHLLRARVLGLVEDDEAVVEGPAAHVGERGDLDHAPVEVLRDPLGLEHVVQRIEQRPQIRVDLGHEIAGQEPEP